MSLALTDRARRAASAVYKEPNIVLEIEGIGTIYGASVVRKDLLIGDDDFFIGATGAGADHDDDTVGGLDEVADQENAILMTGTTTSIRQMLQIDLGQGTSISTMQIALLDDGSITQLISPGFQSGITDILQVNCKVYLGFNNVAFPEDYIVIFRGVVTDVTSDAGKITLTLNHPDDKKQGSTYKVVKPKLNGAINNSVTTIPLDPTSATLTDILLPVTGPDGSIDGSFEALVKIDDEVIKFTGLSSNQLTGCTRGYLSTTAASHDSGADVNTFYRLQGNCIDLALKIMASTGDGSNYQVDVPASAFVDIDGTPVANSLYFKNLNVVDKYNIQIGDFITTSAATNGANNVTLKEILDIIDTETGQYLVIDDVTFVSESTTSALVAFRSQYDTLPDGLALVNDQIDIDEHIRLHDLFLSTFEYDFRLKDTIDDTRKFLEEQIYSPVAAFSLPRKSRCSMGYHIGPLPAQDIKVFDKTNIKSPDKVKLVRTTNRQFFNEIVYEFDEDISTDDFLSGVITISALSKAQIKGYNKTLTISAKGLRTELDAQNIATSQSNRRLNRYQYAAEVLSFGTLYGDGFNVEIGDIVYIDGTDMQMPDIKTGIKGMAGRYWMVQNKTLNLLTGDVQFDCIDTSFSGAKYGLISPASVILSGLSGGQFTIEPSYYQRYGVAEHKKWTGLVGATVRIRSEDFSMSENTTLVDASTNTIVVSPALSFIPATGMIMELAKYDDQLLEQPNLVYVSMADSDFPDGKPNFKML